MSDLVTRLNAALEGRYSIESELGERGMATVGVGWAVRCPSFGPVDFELGVSLDPPAGGLL